METERNFYILLRHDGKVNEPWLERQALVRIQLAPVEEIRASYTSTAAIPA